METGAPGGREALFPLLIVLVSSGLAAGASCSTSSCDIRTHIGTARAADLDQADADADGLLSEEECTELCLSFTDAELADSGQRDTASGDWVESCGVERVGSDRYRITCEIGYGCYSGRGHVCIVAAAPRDDQSAVARWFAEVAFAEAASVEAFVRLEAELAAHGLPEALRARIREAAEDERRHSAAMGRWAQAHRAPLDPPRYRPVQPRSLVDFAIENAVEGCVRETWGALEALHQAHAAPDPALRAEMARIAEDESRHADLAWALHDWALARLSPAERAAVADHLAAAVAAQADRVARPPDPDVVAALGLPDVDQAMRLWRGLTTAGPLRAAA